MQKRFDKKNLIVIAALVLLVAAVALTAMLLKLDWLMARGMTCVSHGTISTETKDCTWAAPDSALAKFIGPELSDHNACWARCELI